jgi:hypothetical protein
VLLLVRAMLTGFIAVKVVFVTGTVVVYVRVPLL